MFNIREISPDIIWVGASDRRLERFENLFPLPGGVSYNSYLILDEKTVLLDTADSSVSSDFMQNVEGALGGRKLDYLIIHHMEPDHCADIEDIIRRHPEAELVGNEKTFQLFSQFFTADISGRKRLVREGEELCIGKRTLRFFFAPMVHWPEVIFTFDVTDGILFSADAFGTFGALPGNLFADEVDFESLFLEEARRYYANIVGKFGAQVQSALKKLSGLDIKMICPLHGPVWRQDLGYFLNKYDLWSTYRPEKQGVVIFYGSMYGHTANAVGALANKLAQLGVRDMRVYDVSKTHPSYIIADVFQYSHMVMAAPTYNMGLYYPMEALLSEMAALGVRERKTAIIGCHSWASVAAKKMEQAVLGMKGMEILGKMDIRSSLKPESMPEMDAIAEAIAASL